MFLPETVLSCIRILEQSGFSAYAVGGCVRDALLGLTPHDYDLCTNATPTEIAELFAAYPLVRSGEKHGTIGVVMDGQVLEITTFRTEGGYQDGRHPDWVRFVPNLREDLSRRDFTVNAMAYNPTDGYQDPFGGQDDLQRGILRTVGDPGQRFSEDALRILRGVRFAVRFHLTPDPDTLQAMKALSPTMDKLARERVFDELCKLLPLVTAKDLMDYAPILAQVVPVLSPCLGFLQHSPHHLYDVYEHTAHVVEAAPKELSVRWAALLHDCGKPACFQKDAQGIGHFYGHAQESTRLAEEMLTQLKAPKALRERVCFLIAHHMNPLEPDKRLLRRWLGKFGEAAMWELLALQEADVSATVHSTQRFAQIRQLFQEILSEEACLTLKNLQVSGSDLLLAGFAPGPQMGDCLQWLLQQVQDELLPNEKQALLTAAQEFLRSTL